MDRVKIWDKPILGKLFAVGDLHGSYNLLMNRLNEIGFDFSQDLLVGVGDLVDRGQQNIECADLINQSWFTTVMGNHEELCIRGMENHSYYKCHIQNGGGWFYELGYMEQQRLIQLFKTLPVALEIQYNGKKFGFVHGHIEQNNWDEFKQDLNDFDEFNHLLNGIRYPTEIAMWGRDRLDHDRADYTAVKGVDAVIMGHTVTQKPCKRDNCYWIDTGAVHWGTLTILDLSTL